jgi:hypothetical protein
MHKPLIGSAPGLRVEHVHHAQGRSLGAGLRDATEGAAYEWLSGRIMHVDLATGKILGSVESPEHWLTVSPPGDIFAASLTGNVLRWTPGWPERH